MGGLATKESRKASSLPSQELVPPATRSAWLCSRQRPCGGPRLALWWAVCVCVCVQDAADGPRGTYPRGWLSFTG